MDNEAVVIENRLALAETCSISPLQMLFPDQCHSSRVIDIVSTVDPFDLSNTDGLVTRRKGICLCILAADCVPILLYDPFEQVIAALHAGWRGTYGRIVSRAIERMVKIYGCKPAHILAGIGPSISQQQYEVGNEVSGYFKLLFSDHPEIVKKNPDTGKDHIDLQGANRILLHRAGLKDEHMEVSSLCTFNNPDLFFSARRDGVECGRFATGIMLI
jgi:polyphenol oxidase